MNNKLKEMRKQCGLTQEKLAIKAGITTRAVQNYEEEKRTPNVRVAMKLAAALCCKVEEIF